ncbi:MAG: ATP-dependent RecD-like DNA helicase [Candidatus Desulforudis sp.]|nr:ATP-dependent RecD-like DNA helicase [Desulforudis sp.]
METIYGYLERITYYNEETHFIVARLQERGKKELTTIVGNLAGLNPGESLKLSGEWVHDKKFGPQFRVEKFETVVPATVNGIKKYLGSGLIKGIGPGTAQRIVKVFGLDTFDVIENSPEDLARVEGVGSKRIAMITRAWDDQKDIKEIMVFLQGHGVSAAHAARIYRQYGKAAVDAVRNNPYRLAADVHGIGFVTADRIARHLGFDLKSILRVEEGTLYVLRELMNEGHVYYPRGSLLEKTATMLEVESEIVREALERLVADKRIVLEAEAVYLSPFFTAEANLSKRLTVLREAPSAIRPVDTEQALLWVEKKLSVRLAEKQREAVALAVRDKVVVITGGPGTGKTTIIKAIVQIFKALQLRVLLAAPTGRAAKRVHESTGYEARTIHRLLEFSPRKNSFQRDQDCPLEADVVIVDEASMIDTVLMYHLVKAIPLPATFILVGDVNQLPSVGPGNVLRDIIDSGEFKVVTLTEIFRQSRESRIVVNAHRINHGEFPDIRRSVSGMASDFYFIAEEDPDKVVETILKLCKERIPKRFGFHPVRDIQVLTPMHKGLTGVGNLNYALQNLLNPGGSGINRGHRTFKVKDKVMQIVNNYDKDVFNGDIGWITAINQEDQEVTVDFEGRAVKYEFPELDELVPAYAVSVHKSQGSEYPAVIMPVTIQHYMLLQRNLLYTGVTRGKQLVVLVGTKKALAIAIRNDKPQKRYSRLRERLKQAGSGLRGPSPVDGPGRRP